MRLTEFLFSNPRERRCYRSSPGTSVRHAVTLMMENDYSQLPVLEDGKTIKGMFSWRSYGKRLAMGHKCVSVDDTMEPAPVLDLDASLFEAFAAVSRNDAVLIQNHEKKICGIVTAYDVSETFGTLVEPFLLIEEVEKYVRVILQGHVVEAELTEAVSMKKATDLRPKISDLNFGGYILLLKKVEMWNRLGLNLEQAVFVQNPSSVLKQSEMT